MTPAEVDGAPIGAVLDLTLRVSVEIGRTTMNVRDLVRLCPGSVIALDRPANEPVTVYVGARRFGAGAVVVSDEHFAVRIEQVFSPDAGPMAGDVGVTPIP